MSQLNGKKLTTPKHIIIEKVAGELAATFYEIGRGQGGTSKYPNARAYAKANIENFIPKAVEILTDMLSMPHISQHMKDEIAEALIERANDPDLAFFDAPKKELPQEIKDRVKNSFGVGDYGYGKKAH